MSTPLAGSVEFNLLKSLGFSLLVTWSVFRVYSFTYNWLGATIILLQFRFLRKDALHLFLSGILFLLAPFRAPTSVISHNASSTNLVVKWSHLLEEDFQGQPIGYIITYHPNDLENDLTSIKVNFTRNSTTLTNLTGYTVYVIKVSAVSSGGIGPANTVKARTDAGGKKQRVKLDLHYDKRAIVVPCKRLFYNNFSLFSYYHFLSHNYSLRTDHWFTPAFSLRIC